jgi:hypothetical protein
VNSFSPVRAVSEPRGEEQRCKKFVMCVDLEATFKKEYAEVINSRIKIKRSSMDFNPCFFSSGDESCFEEVMAYAWAFVEDFVSILKGVERARQ